MRVINAMMNVCFYRLVHTYMYMRLLENGKDRESWRGCVYR